MTAPRKPSSKHARKRVAVRTELGRKVAVELEYGGRKQRHREHGSSKFRPEYARKLLAFFDTEAHRAEQDLKSGLTTHVFNAWPTFQAFAASIGCTDDTLRRWATEVDQDGNLLRPDFSSSYARAREMQQHLLMQGGMSGAYPAGFACLAAKTILGWKDKVESDNTHVIREVDTSALDAIYQQKLAESAAMNATRGL